MTILEIEKKRIKQWITELETEIECRFRTFILESFGRRHDCYRSTRNISIENSPGHEHGWLTPYGRFQNEK